MQPSRSTLRASGMGYLPTPPIVFERIETRWEYHTVAAPTPLDADRLNALGREGWLLAAALAAPDREGTLILTYHFLRAARD